MAKILIIDSNPESLKRIKRDLTGAGHECLTGKSAEHATQLALEQAVDLLITDVMLPKMSGFSLCRHIRRHRELFSTPVMLLSAMNDEEEVMHGLAQGADDYLGKPFESLLLTKRVQAVLDANADCLEPDPLTGLPRAKHIRREMQHRICNQERFSVVYLEVMHLRGFTRQYGVETRDKIIMWLAKALQDRTQKLMPSENWFFGHVGLGHFVCLLNAEMAQAYCEKIQGFCCRHREEAYTANGVPYPKAEASADNKSRQDALLDVLLCATEHAPDAPEGPQALFDILSRIRNKAQIDHCGGIHVDHRQEEERRSTPERRSRADRRDEREKTV